MKTVEHYILGLDGQKKAIVSFLHAYFTEHFDLQPKISWNIPVYYRKNIICYLNPIKDDGIELAFYRGLELSNDHQLLDSKGRKMVAGIDFYDLKDIDEELINEIINEAIILDDLNKK